jgi:hypothetical protein
MKIILPAVFTCASFFNGFAQMSYQGYIGKYPIQLATYIYSDGDARAVYAYDKHDTPIIINGRHSKDRLELFEKNEKGQVQARLVFSNFNSASKNVFGEWINVDSTRRLKITLTKQFEVAFQDKSVWRNRELIQSHSTDKHYFKLLVSKQAADLDAKVTGVKVIEKETDRLIQKIDLNCELRGLDNISLGDFNFDGLTDFAVFEGSYAGPNTSSIYILRVPDSEKYMVSSFSGISLEFDPESKRIFERNQCCAGRSIMTATYKVVDNKMVLIEQECLEYDDEKEDYIKKKCD